MKSILVLFLCTASNTRKTIEGAGWSCLLNPEILKKRRFGDIVVSAGFTDRETLERIAGTMEEGKMLGQTLVEAGLLNEDAVKSIISIQVEEEIFSLFDLAAGEFEFYEEEDGAPPKNTGSLPLFQVEGLVLEAARWQDEWTYIRKQVGDLNAVFFQNPDAGIQNHGANTRDEVPS